LILRTRSLFPYLWLVGGTAVPTQAQSIRGHVVDSSLGSAISWPTVQLSGGGRVLIELRADSNGYFEMHLNGVPDQPLALRISGIGYAPRHGIIRPEDIERDRHYRLLLQPVPYRLEDVTVVGARLVPKLVRTGFADREARGFGHFITEEAIALRNPAELLHMLGAVPGLRVIGQQIYVTRGTRGRGVCVPTVWLDGFRVSDDVLAQVVPEDVLGVEVYRGPAEVPVEYSGANAACGVILVWTK